MVPWCSLENARSRFPKTLHGMLTPTEIPIEKRMTPSFRKREEAVLLNRCNFWTTYVALYTQYGSIRT